MIFYLNYLNNEDRFHDFNITLKKKINKTEKLFFQFLLSTYSKKKDIFLEIKKNKLIELLNLSDEKELIKYLNKFLNLKIYYSFKDFENNLFQGVFNILDSYFIQKENIAIVLSREINLSFDKNNFFNKVNLQCIFNFNSMISLKIYSKLLDTKKYEGSIEFSIEELKEILEIENSYERFYDFEKKILNPIINDLNNFSKYKVTYIKLKNGNFKSAKVTRIKFNYINEVIKKLRKDTNELIVLIKDLIINFNIVHEEILNSLKKYNYDYVYNNVLYSKKNYAGEFDIFLLKALNENLYLKNLNNKRNVTVRKFVKKPYELQEEINKILLKLNLDYIIGDHLLLNSFSKKIYLLRNEEHSYFENSEVKIEVIYKKYDESFIIIDMLK